MEPRIGDVEREAATTRLGDHFAAGRLDHEEYDERLDAIWSARTRADLDQLFEDLPALATTRPSPPATKPPSRDWRFPMWMLALAGVLLLVALDVPWWIWLIAAIVLLKRPWARRHLGTHHRQLGHCR